MHQYFPDDVKGKKMSALQGIRVLDLSRVLAGPWCSQILADLGAEVIKIERPHVGDDTRTWGPPWMPNSSSSTAGRESAYYQSTNRNKYSVAIDMSTAAGQALLHKLVKDVDVVIENYKVGSLAKYQLDYESLSKINPQLVYCSITGYGQTGPRAAEPGYDFVLQGLSGLMSITGEPASVGGEAQKVGVAVTDIQTGLYATIAIQAALWSRQQTQRGQHIDLALFDVQLAALANQSMNYLSTGIAPQRMGNKHPNIVPYQTFTAKDKQFIIACGNDSQFVALCRAIGLPALAQHSDYLRNQDRVKHREQLIEILATHFLQHDAAHWVALIHAAKVPVGLVNDIAEALADPQVQARNMLVNIPHPDNADFKMIASPMKFSATPVRYHRAPPVLGQDTAKVLAACCDQEEIVQLEQQGIIGLAR